MSREKSIDPLLLIGGAIVLAAALTWVVPSGQYRRTLDPALGRTVVVPGTYAAVPPSPVGPWQLLLAIPQGLLGAAPVVFYVFLAGGALTVVEATGALSRTLDALVGRFPHRPLLMVPLVSALFIVGGATYGMYDEVLAFVPLLCVLMRRLRMGALTALGVSVGSATVAASFSPVNTFHLGVSQPMAQLSLFSGFGFRAVFFVPAMGIWLAYVTWFAARERRRAAADPEAAPGLEPTAPGASSRRRDFTVLALMNGGMASLVAGAMLWRWDIPECSAVFVCMGWLAGLAGGLGWRGTSEAFAEGLRRMAVAGLLVGFARAIAVVLANGGILDTIAHALFQPLQDLSLGSASVAMLGAQSLLGIPVPSDSGRAMITLPILVPLADLLGLSRQVVVLAYQYAGLVSNLLTPTGGSLLAMVALAEVPFGRWLRYVAPAYLALAALAAVALVVAATIGLR